MTDCEICGGTLSNRLCHGLTGDGPAVHVECEANARRLYPQPAPPAQPDAAALRQFGVALLTWTIESPDADRAIDNNLTDPENIVRVVDAFLAARAAAGGGS